jgi:hypothetical protein
MGFIDQVDSRGEMKFPADTHGQVDRGLSQVRGETGEGYQDLERLVGASTTGLDLSGVEKPDLVPVQKIQGSYPRCPACTDACPTLVPGSAGSLRSFQFGRNFSSKIHPERDYIRVFPLGNYTVLTDLQ